MTLLFKIVRAAHANGTHHKLALDALTGLQSANADCWQKIFLKHAELYMEGAKAPDVTFKDFKNHVLHVGDGYWGGAAERVQSWYAILVRELQAGRWPEAVYAAGVLSHYFVDPIHPFHTAQSEAENNIHRAVEWSISKSYEDLRRIGLESGGQRPQPGSTGTWLADFVCHGAEKSNKSYGYLIAHYDFNKGVVDPPEGLDQTARRIMAELVVYAADGLAAVLDRAIAEADVVPPKVNLTVDTVLATLKIPVKWVLKKLTDAEDRRQVEAIYDELMSTGHVVENLSEDERVVGEAYAREVLGKREEERLAGRAAVVTQGVPVKPPLPQLGPKPTPQRASRDVSVPRAAPPPVPNSKTAPSEMPVVQGRQTSVPVVAPAASRSETDEAGAPGALAATAAAAHAIVTARVEEDKPRTLEEAVARMRAALGDGGASAEPDDEDDADAAVSSREARARLERDDDVVDAPSIGPKTAARLNAAGVQTVGDLLDADPGALSELLDTRHITARTIRDWQYQSRLMIDVPGLAGLDAQLLVGAGFTSARKVRESNGDDLVKAIADFAKSAEGQRLLRFGKLPDRDRIKGWRELAGAAAKAA